MPASTHPRQAARRTARLTSWWGKAWQRAVEESAYDQADLLAGRRLARAGKVGGIIVDSGTYVAAVEEPRGMFSVSGTVPVLDDPSIDALVEAVAATPGRIAALLAGDLPHDLLEHAEEVGAELLPYGGELGSICTCEHWADSCAHALAVGTQLGWLVDADPLVLFQLRGLARDDLLARLHTISLAGASDDDAGEGAGEGAGGEDDPAVLDDLDVALEAALRVHRLLRESESTSA